MIFNNNRRLSTVLIALFISTALAQPFDPLDNTSVGLGNLPFTGVIPVGQYHFVDDVYEPLDTILLNLSTGERHSNFAGQDVWLHPDGIILLQRDCADGGNVYMLWERGAPPREITPCSSSLRLESHFDFAKLSPDQKYIAVEHYYKTEETEEVDYDVVVFDLENNTEAIATFENHFAPAWLPDGRLMVGGSGIFISDTSLEDMEAVILLNQTERVTDNIDAGANNLAINPEGTRIVFEYNRGIWHINLDGSEFFELIQPSNEEMKLYFPAWSHNGSAIVYMARPESGYALYNDLFFNDIHTGEGYILNITPLLDHSSDTFVSGPLSWR